MPPLPEPPASELEALVASCLEAPDPGAELDRRTAGNPDLRQAAWQIMQQVLRLERSNPTVVSSVASAPGDPAWPSIPGHVLEAVLGRGGQGTVYRARHVYLDRKVAVKVLSPDLRSTLFAERFRREARTLASLSHPHIVACLHAGVTDHGDCYLVMELVEGDNLSHWIEQNGRLPIGAAIEVTRALAKALAHAHHHGIVHRDVKPENVLLRPRAPESGDRAFPFVPQLADLGLSRPMQTRTDQRLTLLTPAGTILGSPLTMAPEQFDAPDSVDLRADIYGLGCVLHHAVTGKPAYERTSLTDLMAQKNAPLGPDVRRYAPELPAALAALVSRMLARDPGQRPRDYAEVQRELAALRAPQAPAGSRARRVAALALALALAGGGVALAFHFANAPAVGWAEHRLFPAQGDEIMPLWRTEAPKLWDHEDNRRGVVVHSRDARTEARTDLPKGAWALHGFICPRGRWDSDKGAAARVAAAGCSLEFPGGDRLDLAIEPVDDSSQPYRAVLRRLRQQPDRSWLPDAVIAQCDGDWSQVPLEVHVRWSGDQLTCSFDTAKAEVVPSAWPQHGAPGTLVLYAELGTVAFTDWVLSPAN